MTDRYTDIGANMSDIVTQILQESDLSTLIGNFKRNKIDSIEIMKSLKNCRVKNLGIQTIGDQVKFREKVISGMSHISPQ